MDRAQQIRSLTARLAGASGGGDWNLVKRLDAQVAALMAAGGGRSGAEQAALVELKRVHARAREHCRRELERVRARLHDLSQHRDARLAYAMYNEVN